jgi:membrane-associated phospholipid phosphatase
LIIFQKIDNAVFYFINGSLHNALFDPVMTFVTRHPPLLFSVLLLLLVPKYRTRLVLPVILSLLAFGLSDGVGGIIKNIVARPRPFEVLPYVHKLVGAGGYSFPSSHASNTFAFATGISYFFRGAAIPFLALAAIVSFSRIYVGVHYPSDVLGGMLWGVASFFIVLGVYRKIKSVYERDKYSAAFFIISLSLIVFRLLYIQYGPLDLVGDEAHYWEWTRRLALSYYSKGPLIAYLIALTTGIAGNTVLAVRFLAPFLLFGGSFYLYKLGAEMFGNAKAGVVAGLLLQTTVIFATYGLLMTIDSPFIFLWCLALWFFWQALKTDKKGYLYLTGIVVGLGFLAKYTMLFFFLCAFIFLLLSRQDRRRFRSVHLYLAFFLSLIVMSPVFIWNAQHRWVTLLHTEGHIHVQNGLMISPGSFFDFLGSQLGVITPLLSFLMIYLVVKYRRSYAALAREKKYLLSFSLPVLVFFLLKSVQGKVEGNWPMPSYPALFVLSSFYLVEGWKGFGRKMRAFAVASIISSVLFTGVAHFPEMLHLPPRLDMTKRLAGWKELGGEITRISSEMAPQGRFFIFSDSYQVASEVAFYAKGNPITYCVNLGRRMDQYDLWPGIDRLIGYNAVFVMEDDQQMPPALARAFGRYERRLLVLHTRQHKIMKFTVFKCYDFKGIELKPSESY